MNVFDVAADLKNRATARIWEPEVEQLPLWKSSFLKVVRLLLAVGRDIHDGQISLRAMSLVYTTLLSLVPLLAICFSVLKGFGVHNQIEPMLLNLLEPLGEKSIEITDKVIQFVDNIQVGVLGAVGVALLIYSVISLMHKIETSFNYIWHIADGRTFAQRFGDYLSVLLVGPLLMFLSMGITASFRNAPVIEKLTGLQFVGGAFDVVGYIVPYILLTIAFSFIYMFMPHTRVRLFPALCGGLVAAVLWKLLGFLFSTFVTGSANYAAVYSAFATLILFMIWLYVGWQIMLIGASISYYIQNPGNQMLPRDGNVLSARARDKIALMICALVGEHFYNDKPAWTVDKLASYLRVPARPVQEMLSALYNAGILEKTADRPAKILPASPFDQTSVYEMLSRLRHGGEDTGIDPVHIRSAKIKNVEPLIEETLKKGLGGITLKQLSSEE